MPEIGHNKGERYLVQGVTPESILFMVQHRILALSLSLMLLLGPAAAWGQGTDTLGALETQIFARQFAQESEENRLSRLEKTIFGEAQKGDVSGRTRHLEQVLKASAPMPASTGAESSDSFLDEPQQEAMAPKVPEATDYPAVTELEQRVFRQIFPKEDVSSRLKRLEEQVFHQAYDELPMVDRVDQLTLKVMPGSALSVEEGVLSGLPNKSSDFAGTNVAVYSQVTALEEQVLGRTYAGDMLTNRLSRLEQQVFGSARQGSVDSRVEQLVAKYPMRNRQQTWQSPSTRFQSHPSYRFGDNASRINRAIGQSLSPEMQSMLPQGVRNQLQQGAPPPSLSTLPSPTMAPDSMTWSQTSDVAQQNTYSPPQSLYQNPGQVRMQPYGNGQSMVGRPTPVVPYGQPYGTPLVSQGQVMVPQQINPQPGYGMLPQAQNMALPYNGMMPQQQPNMLGYGQVPMMGQPNSLVQSVTVLESQVFGQTFNGSTLLQRLNNLEKNVFGTTYPKYSPQQRINRLMNRAVPQSRAPVNPMNRLLGKSGKSSQKGPNILQSALGAVMSAQMASQGQLQQQAAPYGYQTDAYGNVVDPYYGP